MTRSRDEKGDNDSLGPLIKKKKKQNETDVIWLLRGSQ